MSDTSKNNADFDFSVISQDCESSDGQSRHTYFSAKETKKKPEKVTQ